MSQATRGLNTRNKSYPKDFKQGALPAGANPSPQHRLHADLSSRQRVKPLPQNNNNKSRTNVSVQPQITHSRGRQNVKKNLHATVTSSSSPGSPGILSNVYEIDSEDSLDGSRSNTTEGDNRGVISPAKQTAEETPQNTFASQPSDPWHETFTELRAMRARMENMDTKMGKLDTIEESTSSLSSQILTVVQKTTEIKAKVEINTTKADTNATKIRDLKREGLQQ